MRHHATANVRRNWPMAARLAAVGCSLYCTTSMTWSRNNVQFEKIMQYPTQLGAYAQWLDQQGKFAKAQ
eukprot:gene7038-7028_t